MKNGITCVGMSRVYHMYDLNTFSTAPALFALKRLPLINNVKPTLQEKHKPPQSKQSLRQAFFCSSSLREKHFLAIFFLQPALNGLVFSSDAVIANVGF